MDVAKYIGLFLLKNNFVYIHGLGNLEIKKTPARHNGEALIAPSYKIVMTPMGSIDDVLANYIATNEQISISKASNALREFSMQARSDIQKGKKIEIPGIGHFTMEKGNTVFVTSPDFTYSPPAIPTIKNSKRLDEIISKPIIETAATGVVGDSYGLPEYPEDEGGGSSYNWGKIAMVSVGALVIAALLFFGIRYMNEQNATSDLPLVVEKDTMPLPALDTAISATPVIDDSTTMTDSATVQETTASTIATNAAGALSIEVLVNTYDNIAKAQSRTQKLKSYGHNAVMKVAKDSTSFFVVIPVSNIATADTAHLLDSFKRYFNPNGVSIYK